MHIAAVALLAAPLIASGAPTQAQDSTRLFPDTGKTVGGRFLQYWDEHGGLAQQGFPISERMQEQSETDGKTYTVQYFERAVFEAHPENAAPYDVLLSLLGNFRYNEKYPDGAPNQVASAAPGARKFDETGRTLGGKFLEYWETHGGLAQQGFPISDEFTEISDLNGQPYTVQYFERAVFELHPENAGTPSEVLLSQLGTFEYRARYSGAQSPTPGPTAAPLPPRGTSGRVDPTAAMSIARACHSATLLPNGTVLVAGGQQRNGELTKTAEIYDPASGSFTPTGSMAASLGCHEAVLLPGGNVLVAGGAPDPLSAELYDPASGTFSPTSSMTEARYEPFSATLLRNGKVLVAGGYRDGLLSSAELYDPASGTFSPTGSMTEGRANQTSTLLPNGKVLVAGGGMAELNMQPMLVLSTAELYDPDTGAFTRTGDMATARYKHGAALLPDGRVLVVAGSDMRQLSGLIASAELYDPTTGVFSPAGAISAARYKIGDAVAVLPGGKVVVGGGEPVEVFDPVTSAFPPAAGAMGFPRLFQSATVLPNNTVLLAGGYNVGGIATTGAWIFKP
jgi:hypothetical protein